MEGGMSAIATILLSWSLPVSDADLALSTSVEVIPISRNRTINHSM